MVVGWGGSEGESRERGLADCGGGGGLICSAVCRRSVLTAFQRGEGEGKGGEREKKGMEGVGEGAGGRGCEEEKESHRGRRGRVRVMEKWEVETG